MVAVSEEVRSRCHVKHTLPRWPVETNQVNELISSDAENMSNQTVSIQFRNGIIHHLPLIGIFVNIVKLTFTHQFYSLKLDFCK